MIKVTIASYMCPTAYQDPSRISDYQLDMIFHGFSSLPDVQVQFVPEPYWMKMGWNNSNVWGKSFTLYGLVNKFYDFDVEDSDIIICGLHHSMCERGREKRKEFHNEVGDLVKKYGKKVCVVDGHDTTDYLPETAALCKYFKRESGYNKDILPIFFAFPEEKFSWEKVDKIYDFSPMVPANSCWADEAPCEHLNTYIYNTEEEYYSQYQKSYFAYNCRKAGWNTGRQGEIIMNRCIPYFTDVEAAPKNSLFRYPVELCIEAKHMAGVHPGTIEPYNPHISTYIGDTRQIKYGEQRGYIDFDKFNLKEYETLQNEFFSYAWKNLTTKSLANYILTEVF